MLHHHVGSNCPRSKLEQTKARCQKKKTSPENARKTKQQQKSKAHPGDQIIPVVPARAKPRFEVQVAVGGGLVLAMGVQVFGGIAEVGVLGVAGDRDVLFAHTTVDS